MARLVVEVVYALPGGEESVRVSVPPGATVQHALDLSGLAPRAQGKVGIFGKVVPPDAPVADGDRIEIYRSLATDPKEARRRRAARPRRAVTRRTA